MKAPCNYNAESHEYTGPDGKLWPGVTTITGNLNKGFLGPWYAKMAIEAVAEKLPDLFKSKSTEETQKMLDECKKSAREKSEQAKRDGTEAHDWIDLYIHAKIAGDELPEATPGNESVRNAINAFLDWEREVKPRWIEADCVVGSAQHEYGGRFDALAEIGDQVVLVDFKTSSQFSEDYFIQLAGYQIALEEMGEKVDNRLLLRLPKDGKPAEELYVPTPEDLDKKAFLGLRDVQKFLSYVNNGDHQVKANGRIKVAK